MIKVQSQHVGEWLRDLGICSSKNEAMRLIKQGGISFNKEKLDPETKYLCFYENKVYFLSEHPKVISDLINEQNISTPPTVPDGKL